MNKQRARKLTEAVLWAAAAAALLMAGFGMVHELLPDRSVVPENVFKAVFLAQFIVIAVVAAAWGIQKRLEK